MVFILLRDVFIGCFGSERFQFLSLYKGMVPKWGTYYHQVNNFEHLFFRGFDWWLYGFGWVSFRTLERYVNI
jgi:hypothetical protein